MDLPVCVHPALTAQNQSLQPQRTQAAGAERNSQIQGGWFWREEVGCYGM